MIDVEFVVRNYRCFGDEPTRFRISDGFTALIGTNNSGKSSLLRMLYELRPLFVILSSGDNPNSNGNRLLRGGRGAWWSPRLLEGERILPASGRKNVQIDIVVRDGPNGPYVDNNSGELLLVRIVLDHNGYSESLIGYTTSGRFFADPKRPIQDGGLNFGPITAAMAELSRSMYVGPFRNAINVGAQAEYYDIETGDMFVRSFEAYKSGPNPQHNEAVIQLIEDIRRIFGYTSLDINATPDSKSLQLSIDGRSFRLTEQGAGLAHFIVVLVNTLVKQPSFLLIDEPELNLHASLQLDFLSTLAQYTKHGVVFATHSIGLARTSADTIYTLTKQAGQPSRVGLYGSDNELVTLLGQLAFDGRPDLGFNRVLLVEGKSDLRALAQLLRLYDKEHEVLLLPLHGGEMINGDVQLELSELKRLGGDIKYLIDSERVHEGQPLPKSRQDFVDLCAQLEITGHVLDRRALENYLPSAAVKRVFGNDEDALGEYEKRGWRKRDNWRIAAIMTRPDLDDTDLGEFLKTV